MAKHVWSSSMFPALYNHNKKVEREQREKQEEEAKARQEREDIYDMVKELADLSGQASALYTKQVLEEILIPYLDRMVVALETSQQAIINNSKPSDDNKPRRVYNIGDKPSSVGMTFTV